MRTVLSLFDFSGNWSRPYREAGYNVVQVDTKLGLSLEEFEYKALKSVEIMLIAFPCTNYALSGACWFKAKDADGRTAESQRLLALTKEIIDYFNPDIWCLENPMTRIHTLNPWLGKPAFKFNPYDFGDGWKKATWLFGKFNHPDKKPGKNLGGDWHNTMWSSEKTREIRSTTPMGFARAFFEVNP